MNAFAFALIGALLLDLGLYWLWRRSGSPRTERKASPPPQSEEARPSPQPPRTSTVHLTVEVPEGSQVRLRVEEVGAGEPATLETSHGPVQLEIGEGAQVDFLSEPASRPTVRRGIPRPLKQIAAQPAMRTISEALSRMYSRTVSKPVALENTLFMAALVVYAGTRLIRLEDFPIYFFADEAVQAVLAGDLIRDGFRDFLGTFLPTYFQNVALFNLSLSVYLQVIPQLFFENSIFVTRAASVMVTIFGAAGVGLILRDIYKLRHWWAGVLLLSITPAWFLHSRTAFETVLMVSFFIWFFYFYLRYRQGEPKFIYPALVLGAMVFYSYSPGQIIIVGTGLLLLISDFSYHWGQRRKIWWGIPLLGLLVLPYVRFQVQHGGETYFHLRMLNSYWLHDIPLSEKVGNFVRFYLRALSPAYWFFPHDDDLVRHVMKGYGHILFIALPFAAVGLVQALRNFRQSTQRAIILAMLAAPLGMALVGVGLTRILVFIVPATLLTALGLERALEILPKRITVEARSLALMGVLAGINLFMWRDALANGPTWFTDYGLYGMQYGAEQVFTQVERILEEKPDTEVYISPVWANGADLLLRFFMPNDHRVQLLNVDGLLYDVVPEMETKLFVLTHSEYAKVADSPKFRRTELAKVIEYPDGSDGFYFIRLEYAPNAAELIAQEVAELNQPVTEMVIVQGTRVQITHPPFDAGRIQDLFDGDVFTLGRTREANPAVLTLEFEDPATVSGITLTTGSMDIELEIKLFQGEASEPLVYQQTFPELPPDPTVEFMFEEGPLQVTKMEVSVQNILEGPGAKVHLREIVLHP